jgi:hypothetical protein
MGFNGVTIRPKSGYQTGSYKPDAKAKRLRGRTAIEQNEQTKRISDKKAQLKPTFQSVFNAHF